MWCWHRIRESESGLCPACRTPYGEDPHQFSAVDVEEVLKANKEREAAEKRKKQQEMLEQQQQEQQHQHSNNQHSTMHSQQLVGGTGSSSGGGGGTLSSSSHHHHHLPMEVPKDRSQLVNMRVIRRNLVYAVGLPPAVATEDILKKPDYFGQYGRISKIVINRAAVGGDSSSTGRRASASAYVTFVHKEDTLACILALDGFYMEGRNVRASYGTSKYCSAFIKNVRCNNPECTYLHEMGSAEDTFTKQEIQAGYVTSGRDVLARQQQIVAEQLRQSAAGSGNVLPRKRVGGGGPSGTGRSSANPIFPPPEYDEPSRPSTAGLVPPPVGVTRAVTTSSSVASLNPSNIAAKLGRSSSMGRSPPLGGAIAAGAAGTVPAHRTSKSAASIVAGMHSNKTAEPTVEPHTTLTPLTPLKRMNKTGGGAAAAAAAAAAGIKHSNSADDALNPPNIKRGTKKQTNGIRPATASAASAGDGSLMAARDSSSIGGDVIAAPSIAPVMPSLTSSSSATMPPAPEVGGGLTSALGGEVFTGELRPKTAIIGRGADHIGGGGGDKWNNAVGGSPLPTGLWNESGAANSNSSTNALASILGINLPTGSGSLSSGLWSSAPAPTTTPATGPSPLSALNETAMPPAGGGSLLSRGGGPSSAATNNIGSSSTRGSSLIGGVPIGGGGGSGAGLGLSAAPSSMGGLGASIGGTYGGKNDIALLQSLLPGVHITSGNESSLHGAANPNPNSNNNNNMNNSDWNQGNTSGGLGGDTLPGWGGPSTVGAIGQAQSNKGPGIW